jgi:hypothetical protein
MRPEDEISHDEFMAERQTYSDEKAQKLGYPNAEVLRLSDQLSAIAGAWRTTKKTELVTQYRVTLYAMILKGYDVDTLPIQDQLPPEFMPNLPSNRVLAAIRKATVEPDDPQAIS